MTVPGAPMIYYGDEAGMWGGDDPDCRKPMIWKGIKYENESVDPLGRPRPSDPVKFNSDLFNWYKKLISLRESKKALSLGDLHFFLIDNPDKVLGYSRTLTDKTFYIIVNNKSESADLNINLSKESIQQKQLTDLISGKKINISSNKYKLTIPGYGVAILQ